MIYYSIAFFPKPYITIQELYRDPFDFCKRFLRISYTRDQISTLEEKCTNFKNERKMTISLKGVLCS